MGALAAAQQHLDWVIDDAAAWDLLMCRMPHSQADQAAGLLDHAMSLTSNRNLSAAMTGGHAHNGKWVLWHSTW
jgi:hypothetical protein